MKAIIQYTLFIAIACLCLLNLSGCHDDKKSTPEPEPDYFTPLSGEWALESATYNDVAQQGYEGFALVLGTTSTEGLYAYEVSSIRPPLSPWMETGTWQFGTAAGSNIIRDPGTDDELSMQYSATGTQLILQFDFIGEGYEGRTSSVSGKWKFQFAKKN